MTTLPFEEPTPDRRGPGTPANQSVDRAVRLLSAFTVDEPELSLNELMDRVGTGKATTHRYAMALRERGLLRYDAISGLYSLGPRVVEMAAAALASLQVIGIAGPYMDRLVDELNETCVLSVWDGERPVVVKVNDRIDRVVRLVVQTGTRLPLSSSQGRVFCAYMGDGALAQNGMTVAEAEAIRDDGVAVNSQVMQGVRAVAAPVFQGGTITATLAVIGTTAAIPEEPDSPVAALVRQTAQRLSAQLG